MTADAKRAHAALAVTVALLVLAAGALAVARLALPHMPEVRALVREVRR